MATDPQTHAETLDKLREARSTGGRNDGEIGKALEAGVQALREKEDKDHNAELAAGGNNTGPSESVPASRKMESTYEGSRTALSTDDVKSEAIRGRDVGDDSSGVQSTSSGAGSREDRNSNTQEPGGNIEGQGLSQAQVNRANEFVAAFTGPVDLILAFEPWDTHPDGGCWIVQGKQFDYCAQGKTKVEAFSNFRHGLLSTLALTCDPRFQWLDACPEKEWNDAAAHLERVEFHQMRLSIQPLAATQDAISGIASTAASPALKDNSQSALHARQERRDQEIAYQTQVLTEHGLLEEFGPLIGGALLSYLAEAVAASREQGWQSMETAPKDGTRVLVTAGAAPWVSYWRSEPFGAWMHVWDAATLTPRPFGPITHWRPLPSPPKETT